MAKRSFYIRESELDDFQRQILASRDDGSFVVCGCAGSGKSILALWKAHEIQKAGKGSVKMVVYTKALCSYIRAALQDGGIDPGIVDYYTNWASNPGPRTKYLIVDEAQDFSLDQVQQFFSRADSVMLYGDSAQQLYSFRRRNPPASVEEIAYRFNLSAPEKLQFNHRLPRKIARFAMHISPARDPLDVRCRNEGEEVPVMMQCDSLEGQLDAIVDIIRDRGFADVGILLPSNDLVEQARAHCAKRGVPVEAKVRGDVDFNWLSQTPKMMTYHSSKGLQFEAVFLPACDEVRDSFKPALYVAATRSYQSLYLLYSGYETPDVFADIPDELYRAMRYRSNGAGSAPHASAVDSSMSVYDEEIPF